MELTELKAELTALKEVIAELVAAVRAERIESQMMTMDEAAAYLHISRRTMQQKVSDGEINFGRKNGKAWLFDASKIKEYAQTGRIFS
jgi:excisionase family DNA binding protein